jgi:acetolactate synthase I/III small subunit
MSDKTLVHTISLLVSNKPGVLALVAAVFSRRGYNIESLVVSPSFDPRFSRMTITAKGDPVTLDQIIKQTAKLIDVIHVSEHKEEDTVHRELALFKVKNIAANRPVIAKLAKRHNGEIIYTDEKPTKGSSCGTIVVQQIGTTEQLDALEVLLRKYNIIEMVRSGKIAVAKGIQET